MKKLFIAMLLAVSSVMFVPANNVAQAQEVYMGNFAGKDYYIESDSIFGDREKFTVRLITEETEADIIFSAKGVLAMAVVGKSAMMVNGNPLLEKIYAYCLDSGRLD